MKGVNIKGRSPVRSADGKPAGLFEPRNGALILGWRLSRVGSFGCGRQGAVRPRLPRGRLFSRSLEARALRDG